MPEIIRSQVEASLRFDGALDITEVEELALEQCKEYCDREIGWSMWPYSCDATSAASDETREVTLRCESTACLPTDRSNYHPIFFALKGLAEKTELQISEAVSSESA